MAKNKNLNIPLYVNDSISDPPTKPSGYRRIIDLNDLDNVAEDDILIVQHGSRTFKVTKSALLKTLELDGVLTQDGLWDDYVTDLSSAAKGASSPPAFNEWRTGLRANQFAVGDEVWASIHIRHDWKPGTNVYPHIHWLTNAATPAGSAVWQLDYSIAKRNDVTPQAFPAPTTLTLTQAMTTQYGHMVVEASDLQAIDGTTLEVDCLIEFRVKRITDGGAGGDGLAVFGLQLDCHYQKDRLGTIGKAPDFYT